MSDPPPPPHLPAPDGSGHGGDDDDTPVNAPRPDPATEALPSLPPPPAIPTPTLPALPVPPGGDEPQTLSGADLEAARAEARRQSMMSLAGAAQNQATVPHVQRQHPSALRVFFYGLAAWMCCNLLSPFAYFKAREVRRSINDRPDLYTGKALAVTGEILGAIGTLLLLLSIAYVALVLTGAIEFDTDSP